MPLERLTPLEKKSIFSDVEHRFALQGVTPLKMGLNKALGKLYTGRKSETNTPAFHQLAAFVGYRRSFLQYRRRTFFSCEGLYS
jgi:hypothetical protein